MQVNLNCHFSLNVFTQLPFYVRGGCSPTSPWKAHWLSQLTAQTFLPCLTHDVHWYRHSLTSDRPIYEQLKLRPTIPKENFKWNYYINVINLISNYISNCTHNVLIITTPLIGTMGRLRTYVPLDLLQGVYSTSFHIFNSTTRCSEHTLFVSCRVPVLYLLRAMHELISSALELFSAYY